MHLLKHRPCARGPDMLPTTPPLGLRINHYSKGWAEFKERHKRRDPEHDLIFGKASANFARRSNCSGFRSTEATRWVGATTRKMGDGGESGIPLA